MKVAQICPTFFGEASVIGGAERYVLELSRHLSRQVEVSIITFSQNDSRHIGAYVGEWSRMAVSIFPSAQLFMIDANPENEVLLQEAQRRIGPTSQYSIILLGPEDREEVAFYQLGSGSSVLRELTSFARHTVRLPMTILDGLLGAREVERPALLKLDVQGFELEVLRGGRKILSCAEAVILETALLPYNQDAPLFAEVLAFKQDAGFVVYDFCGQFRRQTDHALCQTDVAFVKEKSELRAQRKLWLHEQ